MGRCGSLRDCCGSLWIVVGRCGSLRVVPGFSNYEQLGLRTQTYLREATTGNTCVGRLAKLNP